MTQRPNLPSYNELRQRNLQLHKQLERLGEQVEKLGEQTRSSEVRRVALGGELDRLRQRLADLELYVQGEHADAEYARRQLGEANAHLAQAQQLASQRQREVEQSVSIAVAALQSVRAEIDRIESSTAWRIGHVAASGWNRLRRRTLKTEGAVHTARARIDEVANILLTRGADQLALAAGDSEFPQLPAGQEVEEARPPELAIDPEAEQHLASRIRAWLDRAPERSEWPPVVLVVINREEDSLEPLLAGLSLTEYPAMEAVVLSRDPSRVPGELLDQLPLTARVQPVAGSFAAACNDLAASLTEPLLAFLDDARPFESGWLKELVDGLLASGGGALGATLVEPADDGFVIGNRGFVLERAGGLPRPRSRDAGKPLFGAGFGIEAPCAAASGSCMVVDRDSFLRVGGFETGYRQGGEDIELALSLGAAGERVACSSRAVVFSSRSVLGAPSPAGKPKFDELRLIERWGPALRRELRLALSRRDRRWVDGEGLHVAVAGGIETAGSPAKQELAAELALALSEFGWRTTQLERESDSVRSLPEDADVLIALSGAIDPGPLEPWVTAVALIGETPERWTAQPNFDRYDILLARSQRIADAVFASCGRMPASFPPATNPSRFAAAHPDPALQADYALVAHRRDELKPFEEVLAPRNGEQPALYGEGWRKRGPLRAYGREAVGEERLAAVYASSKLLIADPGDDDGVHSAVIDSAATGALPLAADAGEARHLFDDEFPAFSDPESLRIALDGLLGDAERRITLSRRYRRQVLAEHTYAHRAHRLRELIEAGEEQLSFCLKIGAPNWERAQTWGDLYLARDLARALKRRGHRCLIQVRAEWNEPVGLTYDVVVHFKGRGTYAPRPGQFNVLWVLSHPEEVSVEEASAYDLVCVASESYAAELRERLPMPVSVLEQATDPWRFFPDPDPAFDHELVFVGNTRGAHRPLLEDLLPTEHELAAWGSGLDQVVSAEQFKGTWFANDELRKLYSSATVVLCDHWEEMRRHGFYSNRLYDAVACGAVVVTDAVAGLDQRFGAAVQTYSNRDELRATVDRLLSSREERERCAAGGRERILHGHTFDHRVGELLELLERHAQSAGHRARIAA